MQKIVPCLWFDDKAEEAVNFYVSLFKNSKILNVTKYPEAAQEVSGKLPGSVMTVSFQIEGQEFLALNGGPIFKFTEAISFIVNCETQEEIDNLWENLSAVPESEQCGWLKDKYGVSWQIAPTELGEMLSDSDPKKVEAVTVAFLPMKKLDIAELKKAYEEG